MATKNATPPAPKPPKAKADATVWLKAIEPIRCDGDDYAPDDVFETSARVAQDLVAAGAAEVTTEPQD